MKILLNKPALLPDDHRLKNACGFEKCMQCGRCTSSCPAALMYDDYRPRDVMRKLQLGDAEGLANLLWRCGQCYSCAARCPRNNSVGSGILALRESAISSGRAPDKIMAVRSLIRRNLYVRGETFQPYMFNFLEEFGPRTTMRCRDNVEKRVRLGFDREDARTEPIPPDSMAEIRMLMELTGYGGGADV